jgi:hypothetical protein
VYSPGADQVAISTNGTGRLFVDASGNVSIGAQSSSAPLVVTNTSGANIRTSRNSKNLDIIANYAGTDERAHIHADSGMALTFGTGGDVERVRITSAGLVGLGTSSPQDILHVKTDGNTGLEIGSAGTGNGSRIISYDRTAGVPKPQVIASETFSVQTSTTGGGLTSRLHVTSAGLVGIGTTSPAQPLHIKNAGSSACRLILENSGSTAPASTQIWSQNNDLVFDTDSSEVARIDSSGRLLVGTSTARSNVDYHFGAAAPKLQLEQSDGGPGLSILHDWINTTNEVPGTLSLGRSGASSIGSNAIVANNNWLGVIDFLGADGSDFTRAASIKAEVDGTPGANDMPGRLVFSTTADGASSPTERMRITSGGFLKVSNSGSYIDGTGTYNEIASNQQSSAALILRASNASLDATVGVLRISCTRNTTNDSYYPIVYFNEGGGATRFLVADDGDCRNANNSYGGISDIKLKENIVDAASQWNDLKTLKIRKYNFKQETGQPTHTQIGLIAQEAELVSPGLVSESPDRDAEGNDLGTVTKSVNYSVLYMKAVKALQEAMERIEQLETEMAEVKAQLQAL